GNWLPWLEREFGWEERSARNFMQVFEASKSANFADLDLPVSALYLLAAPSTPEAAKTEILERAKAGESLPVEEVKRVVDSAKGRKPRNLARAMHHRRMKLGDDVVDALKNTSLGNARELDELVRLNRGAPKGGHTKAVQQLVAAVEAGNDVSAVTYTKSGA